MNAALDRLLPQLLARAHTAVPRPLRGKVRRIRGIMVYASLPMARIGELCYLRDPLSKRKVAAQVEPVTALLHARLGMLQIHGDASLGPRHATLSSPVAAVDLDVDEQLHGLRLALGLPDAAAPGGPGR